MNISKKFIASVAGCAVLGVSVTAYAVQTVTDEIPEATSSVSEIFQPADKNDAGTTESIVFNVESTYDITVSASPIESTENGAVEAGKNSTKEKYNAPSDGDEIVDEKYFYHTFSNGTQARIPFIQGTGLDVETLKTLGSDTPFSDEEWYHVLEFIDGTKRYFKIGDTPRELYNHEQLQYGVIFYSEKGTCTYEKYYEDIIPEGTISGWR
ncbi:MAG: hypothetical protein ACI4JS_09500 [Oscillospiraceae bacterium]